MFDKFTDKARKTLLIAREFSEKHQKISVDLESVLYGLVSVSENALKVLDPEKYKSIKKLVNDNIDKTNESVFEIRQLPYTPRVKKGLEYSLAMSRKLNHKHIGTEHLLLAILNDKEIFSRFPELGITASEIMSIIKNYYHNNSIIIDSANELPMDRSELTEMVSEESYDLSIDMWIDVGNANSDDIAELLNAMSDLNRAYGGDGLNFVESLDNSYVAEMV